LLIRRWARSGGVVAPPDLRVYEVSLFAEGNRLMVQLRL
jgi:hypothetical protein